MSEENKTRMIRCPQKFMEYLQERFPLKPMWKAIALALGLSYEEIKAFEKGE